MAATQMIVTVLIATSFAITFCGASGPASAPVPQPMSNSPAEAPMPDCMTNLLNMSDCLSYVEAGSNATKPDAACCPELAGLVESSPQCLCYLLGGSVAKQYGFDIDMNRALKLPSVCGVTTPSPSLCSVLGIPVGAPMADEGSTSPGAEAPGGLAASPSAGNNRNGASHIAGGSPLFSLIGLSIALLMPFF